MSAPQGDAPPDLREGRRPGATSVGIAIVCAVALTLTAPGSPIGSASLSFGVGTVSERAGTPIPPRTAPAAVDSSPAGLRSASPNLASGLPRVVSTLVLLNDTLIPGNFHANNGLAPQALCYDRPKDVYFVADGSNVVSVVSAAQHKVLAMIPVGLPLAVACDISRGEAFVASFATTPGFVAVISDSTYAAVANVTVGAAPDGIAWDSARRELFVANGNSNNVSVISDTNNSVVATIPVGSGPQGIAYDPGKGEIFVVNRIDDSVSVISDATNTVVATTGTGYGGGGSTYAAYDPGTNEIFVSNPWYNTLTVISDATNYIVAYIPVGTNPAGLAYDAGARELFVADAGSNDVTVIPDATGTVNATISVGLGPIDVGLDNRTGDLFVANSNSDTISVVSVATNRVTATISTGHVPSALAYDGRTHQVFVADGPSGTVWAVNETTGSVAVVISVGRYPQALAYDAGRSEIFVANGGSNNLSVISDVTDKVVAAIPVGNNPYGLVYDAGVGEVFVANIGFAPNVVSVISDASNTIVANISVGNVPSGLAVDSGKHEVFAAKYGNSPGWGGMNVLSDATNQILANISTPTSICCPGPVLAYDAAQGEILLADSSGAISVISDVTNTIVASIPVAGWPAALTYTAVKGEVGQIVAADSRSPNVTFLSDASNAVVGNVTVGSLASSAIHDPDNGYYYVSNEFQGTVSLVEPGHWYSVSFPETGLPVGTPWSVTLGGTTESSATPAHVFTESNGTFPFIVHPVPGYTASPSSGLVVVAGANVTVGISFFPVPFNVTLQETGLPAGAPWWVNLTRGGRFMSNTTVSQFQEANGSYGYAVATTDKRYSAAGGTFVVQGRPVTIAVPFHPVRYALTFTQAALPAGLIWSVNVSGVRRIANGSAAVFQEMNGSYAFVVVPPSGYVASPASGTVGIRGAAQAVSVQMTPAFNPAIYYYVGSVVLGVVLAAVVVFLFRRRRRRARPPPTP